MKEKNKSTIFYIIITMLFAASFYIVQQNSSPVAKQTKEATTLGNIIDDIIAVTVRSISITLCIYGIACLYSINKTLKLFRTKIIEVYVKDPTKKRIKRYKKNRNEQI